MVSVSVGVWYLVFGVRVAPQQKHPSAVCTTVRMLDCTLAVHVPVPMHVLLPLPVGFRVVPCTRSPFYTQCTPSVLQARYTRDAYLRC